MAVNPVTRPHSKHVAIDYHFVRELVANGTSKVDFIPSHLQLADSLTKGVTKPQFFLFRCKLSIIPSPKLTLQGDDKGESFDSPYKICYIPIRFHKIRMYSYKYMQICFQYLYFKPFLFYRITLLLFILYIFDVISYTRHGGFQSLYIVS